MAGIRKGDVILEANRIRVHSVDDLAAVLKPLKDNSPFLVFIKRGAETIYFSFRIRK
jgi:S1-C subfamily serine protease